MKKFRIPRKLKKKIPVGMYCYTPIKYEFNVYHVKLCPLYEVNKEGISYCSLFDNEKTAKWDLLIDDQCKICGIKDNFKNE